MKSSILELATMLMVEQRYRAIKGSPKTMEEERPTVMMKMQRFLYVSFFANSSSFAVFAFLLITPYIYSPGGYLGVANIGFIVYLYALIISVYSSALFFNSLSSMGLLEPVSELPYSGKRISVMLSWFLYNGSSAVFVILPSTIWAAYVTGNAAVILFGILWVSVFMMLGYSIGASLNVYLMARGNNDRAGILSTVRSSLRVVIILLVFAFFEVGIYLPGAIPDFIAGIQFPLSLFIPLVNVPFTVFFGGLSPTGIVYDSLSTAIYILATAALMLKVNSFSIDKILERGGFHASLRADADSEYGRGGQSKLMFLKEVRIVARKSQNVVLLFIPVIFVFPTILSVLINGSPGGIKSMGTYFSLVSVLIVCSGFYSLILVVSEGNGIATLFSLPVKLKDVIYTKAALGLVVFAIIITPVTVLIMGGSRLSPFDILVPANLVLGYTFSSVFNIRRLMLRVPRGSSTVNFYSFGGGLFIASSFFVTAVMTLSPVLLSAVLSALIFKSVFANPYFFYLADSALNFIALAAVMMLTEKTGRQDISEAKALYFA